MSLSDFTSQNFLYLSQEIDLSGLHKVIGGAELKKKFRFSSIIHFPSVSLRLCL